MVLPTCRKLLAVSISLLSVSISPADGSAFLSRSLPQFSMNVGDLLEELEISLGSDHRARALMTADRLQESLRPTFLALPKKGDLLDATAVRYLLHRYFVDRHGWKVIGFDTEGEAWNSSSPTAVFGMASGGDVQHAIDEGLSRGLSLREVSIMAAALEAFVHAETLQRLHDAYRVLDFSTKEERANETEIKEVLETYMVMYVMGMDHTTVQRRQVDFGRANAHDVYPMWAETTKWIHEVRASVLRSCPEERLSFSATVRVVEEIAELYGRWQDRECIGLKGELLKMERGDTGRVPLSSFYEAALNGQWQFSESKEYLRRMGALDETNPQAPSVMIPNYVNSPANCVAASQYYSVCCINECEALLGYLERQIGVPFASPGRIAELVSVLPSATVDAPRKLSGSLLQRLEDIASLHDGQVPFHGRLFNQWLHHAYPRECPFPHVSGTSKPMKPQQYSLQTGMIDSASEETMKKHIEEERSARDSDDRIFDEDLPWSAEEELFFACVEKDRMQLEMFKPRAFGRTAILVFVAGSFAVTLARMVSEAKTAVSAAPAKDKLCV